MRDRQEVGDKEHSEEVLVGKRPSVFDQTTDLRKEMEMTEHHEDSPQVANRYSTNLDKGLSANEAKIVSTLTDPYEEPTRIDKFLHEIAR